MISNFADAVLEEFYFEGTPKSKRAIPADLHSVVRRKLDQLHNATVLMDLRVPPANRLEALIGDRKGFFSIRVNDQWRIVFRWVNNSAHEVAFVDYH